MKDSVGVIGLGIMGGAFARHLAAAGWPVSGVDLDAGRIAEAKANGVAVLAGVAALAAAARVILVSLPSPAAAIAAAEAIAASGAPPRTVVELSTLSLDDKQRIAAILAAAGHTAIDCPVSGTGAQAANRDVVLYASGDPATIASLTPMFGAFSRRTYDLGAYGNGSRMKFVANLLVAIHNVASAEAMVLGMKAGLDPHRIVELVRDGAGNSRVFELRAPMMAADRYEPATARISMFQKDVAIIADFAKSLGCPVPLFSAATPIYDAAAPAHGEEDTAAVCAVLEEMAGLDRRAD
jgi:3-hydroxyisobutyrate dehydrogenase-like beta-hydroxyacid dehydrogenase